VKNNVPPALNQLRFINDTVVDGRSTSLKQWMQLLVGKYHPITVHPANCFPTPQHVDRFLSLVHRLPLGLVERVLHAFLIPSGRYGFMDRLRDDWLKLYPTRERRFEFERKILAGEPIEGITWVYDLIDTSPRAALEIIDRYVFVHCQVLTDDMLTGLADARSIIRARFITIANVRDWWIEVGPDRLECAVAEWFEVKENDVEICPKGKDGGVDLRCRSRETGRTVLIQCKCGRQKGDVKLIREMNGIVAAEDATEGVLISCGGFTKAALAEASRRFRRLTLLTGEQLNEKLNAELGSGWPNRLERIHNDWSQRRPRKKQES
jgi:hypothetical protein